MDRSLIVSYFYQYGVGLIILLGGLFIARRAGALDLKVRDTRRTFVILLAGMAIYAAFHGLIQFVFPFI